MTSFTVGARSMGTARVGSSIRAAGIDAVENVWAELVDAAARRERRLEVRTDKDRLPADILATRQPGDLRRSR